MKTQQKITKATTKALANRTAKNPAKRTGNPHRRRKKNGAGLGAFLGSLGGSLVGGILTAAGAPVAITWPMYVILSAGGGALGGHYAAPADRKRRGAEGGGIGGVFGPIGAAIGGYVGGTKPDRHKNPLSAVVAGTAIGVAGIATIVGIRHVMKKRAAKKALPSEQPGATPQSQGASDPLPPSQVPKYVIDAAISKGGVPLGAGWKTQSVLTYRDHFIRIDEDLKLAQPYVDGSGQICLQTDVRWVVIAGEATWLATDTMHQAKACADGSSAFTQPIALDLARKKILDQAALAAMDWIDIAFPKPKVA